LLARATRRLIVPGAVLATCLSAAAAHAQTQDGGARASRLSLGFAVDTTVAPATWWGVDPALAARPAVVRLWRDYLAVRADSARRLAFWSDADRRSTPDPDLAFASASYVAEVGAVLVEAVPLVAGDSSRWVLRTVRVGGGTAARPGLFAMERVHVVREGDRWALSHPSLVETADWHRVRIGPLQYVVHPSLQFDAARAAEAARWVDATARRFGIVDPAPITYYQLPNMEAASRVTGLDWEMTTDRVGGRGNARARVVLAADPRFGEAYLHELAHVLLAPWVGGASQFVSEGVAYWLGGARGQPFPAMMRDLAAFLDRHPGLELRAILEAEGQGTAASVQLPAAAALFELAHRRGGDAAVRRLVDATRAGVPTIETVTAALGLAPAELEVAWRGLVAGYRDGDGQPPEATAAMPAAVWSAGLV
jgi:hypothetical protein